MTESIRGSTYGSILEGWAYISLLNYGRYTLSVIEVSYNHLSFCSFNFLKISNLFYNIDLALHSHPLRKPPPKQTLRFSSKENRSDGDSQIT